MFKPLDFICIFVQKCVCEMRDEPLHCLHCQLCVQCVVLHRSCNPRTALQLQLFHSSPFQIPTENRLWRNTEPFPVQCQITAWGRRYARIGASLPQCWSLDLFIHYIFFLSMSCANLLREHYSLNNTVLSLMNGTYPADKHDQPYLNNNNNNNVSDLIVCWHFR